MWRALGFADAGGFAGEAPMASLYFTIEAQGGKEEDLSRQSAAAGK